ncbi:MAG: hypothetical protein GC154_16505 [bacterium]|nr:hypothetical protein [bacterium]
MTLRIPFCLLFAFAVTSSSLAQTVIPIAEINTVDANGEPTFAGLQTTDRYTIEGIALNDGGVFNSEGETSLILFIQDDTGGIEAYAGSWYGSGLANYPEVLQGDRVRVTGLTGHYGGQTNMNERHNPDQKLEITILSHGIAPAPFVIDDLSLLNLFDATRSTGAERYQGCLVTVRDVEISQGEWVNGGSVTLVDSNGATLSAPLRFATKIADSPQPEGRLDVTGVFNQEDVAPPFTEGYQLWPRSIDDFKPAASSSHDWALYR